MTASGGNPSRDPRGPFGAHSLVELAGRTLRVARLLALEEERIADLARLPYSLRVLLENLLRSCGEGIVTEDDVRSAALWPPRSGSVASGEPSREVAFMPSRVLLQDLTGVPCIVDLAAMRSAVARLGGDARTINPVVPVDLVIDHSVHVDFAGTQDAYARNVALEMSRNRERYGLLRWAQEELWSLRVVPPGSGIVHQVNLEYLASVVQVREGAPGRGEAWAFPDTVIGTDSHTTMINGLGVLGWGAGGIEAEAVMLGRPYFMLPQEVVGVRLMGALRATVTATDLALTLTQLLRAAGVVGSFVEYFGSGAEGLSLPDRATVANMAPEYGATTGYFPVDGTTLAYLAKSGRPAQHVRLVEQYCRLQCLFREPGAAEDPEYSRVIEFDLGEVEPSLAGPRRPQDRVPLTSLKREFAAELPVLAAAAGRPLPLAPASAGPAGSSGDKTADKRAQAEVEIEIGGRRMALRDGAVVIASITSCTNTSNPAVLLGAGLLARNAVRRGLQVAPWVKASFAPGSRVVPDYLEAAGLLEYLEALRFNVVGFGCATCIGNSGPLPEPVAQAVRDRHLVVAAVLSGNRNFEARVHPLVRANYLGSPPLVVAYALAGTVAKDLATEPLGHDPSGEPVFLSDLWPDPDELSALVKEAVKPQMFRARYAHVFEGEESWRALPIPRGDRYQWDPDSTYVREPPFLQAFTPDPEERALPRGARVLAVFGESITTDHISPAGSIAEGSPAARYLVAKGVAPGDFNTYGSRRGNHEVLVRGTFANPRLRNLMLADGAGGGREGGWTKHYPSGEVLPIFDASARYQSEGVPLVVLAGKEYGSGSSRDWAAKGPALLGVKAVIAEGFERIHRSNLVGMGILPLEFEPGAGARSLGLTGAEVLDIEAPAGGLRPGGWLQVHARGGGGSFRVRVRLDSSIDLEYYLHGGILPRVLRMMLAPGCAQ